MASLGYTFKFPGDVTVSMSTLTPHSVTFAGTTDAMRALARRMQDAAFQIEMDVSEKERLLIHGEES